MSRWLKNLAPFSGEHIGEPNGKHQATAVWTMLALAAKLRLVGRSPVTGDSAPSSRGEVRAEVRALPVVFGDDAALAQALAAGHAAAPRELWERFSVLVRRLLSRTLASDDVDDAVQEAFLRVFSRIRKLREPDKLRSFVVGVTMRVAREELRRRRVRRWLRLTATGDVPEVRHAGTDHDAVEALRRLDALLERIDSDARVLFVLRFVEDVPTAEIADALECSLATAKRRVARAKARVESAAESDPMLQAFLGGSDG